MREMSVAPLRVLAFVALGALIWAATGLLDPAPERLSAIVIERALFGDEALPDDGVIHVGSLDTTGWNIDCLATPAAVLSRRVAVDPAADGSLAVTCAAAPARVRHVGATLSLAGQPPLVVTAKAVLPSSNSLLPPLLGILCALIFRQVIVALFLAVFLGAFMVEGGALGPALGRTAEQYLFGTVVDEWNLYIFGFTLLLVGMIHVSIRMGGMQGIVDVLGRFAVGRRSAQAAGGVMGCAVFFDDYANTVVVGASMRPLTDRFRISREKLAYIVDSTAAPIAGVAVISTWIGFEISAFSDQITRDPHLREIAANGYEFFFQILPYRFYCLFALALVFIIAWTGRDFGPMLKAERRALRLGQVRAPRKAGGLDVEHTTSRGETKPKEGVPARWINGVLPVFIVITGMFVASLAVGASVNADANPAWANDLSIFGWIRDAFIGASDHTMAILFWASFAGALVAFILAFAQRLLRPSDAGLAFLNGTWTIAPVIAILILAIALRGVTQDLGTDTFLVALIGDTPLWVLPVVIFGLAAFIAFATGTSWGTMSILLPVAIPLLTSMAAAASSATGGLDEAGTLVVLLGAAAVLDGAIFGDHCSLISDTTIMSSLSSGCDHVDHVKTQLPYACLAMICAAILGYGLVAFAGGGLNAWLIYPIGIGLMWAFVRFRGKRPEGPTPTTPVA